MKVKLPDIRFTLQKKPARPLEYQKLGTEFVIVFVSNDELTKKLSIVLKLFLNGVTGFGRFPPFSNDVILLWPDPTRERPEKKEKRKKKTHCSGFLGFVRHTLLALCRTRARTHGSNNLA